MQAQTTSAHIFGHNISSFQTDFTPKREELSIFPRDDLLAKEMESWKAFGYTLREEDRKAFEKMIRQCYKHFRAINAKGESYTTESLFMSLILTQHQIIEFLKSRND